MFLWSAGYWISIELIPAAKSGLRSWVMGGISNQNKIIVIQLSCQWYRRTLQSVFFAGLIFAAPLIESRFQKPQIQKSKRAFKYWQQTVVFCRIEVLPREEGKMRFLLVLQMQGFLNQKCSAPAVAWLSVSHEAVSDSLVYSRNIWILWKCLHYANCQAFNYWI